MYAADVSFGGGGVTDVRAGVEVDVQPDGKVVVTGSKRLTDSSGDTAGFQILPSRLNPDGTIDTSFGTNGTEDITDQPLTIGRDRSRSIGSSKTLTRSSSTTRAVSSTQHSPVTASSRYRS